MTRDEHMDWCKKRALEYIDRGDIREGITSMLSDLSKHEHTRGIGDKLGMLGMFEIMNGTPQSARRFVEGFR